MSEDIRLGQRPRVEYVPSAKVKPIFSLSPGDNVAEARTLMELHNVSQLPVLTKGRPKAVVTWESLARGVMRNREAPLADCMVTDFPQTRLDADLLSLIPQIEMHGYVIVVRPDGQVSGIVTSSDLAQEFGNIASPYLYLGQLESDLRLVLDHLQEKNLATAFDFAACLPHTEKPVQRIVSDYTFGELKTIFCHQSIWPLLETGYSRGTLEGSLSDAVALRNRLMHFRTRTDKDEHALKTLDGLCEIVGKIRKALIPGH